MNDAVGELIRCLSQTNQKSWVYLFNKSSFPYLNSKQLNLPSKNVKLKIVKAKGTG